MTDTWELCINIGYGCGSDFVDFKKALDMVNHDMFISKLKITITNVKIVNLITSFYLIDNKPYI